MNEVNQTDLAEAPVSEIACDMTALTREEIERLEQETTALFAAADDLRVLADGFAIGISDASNEQVISLGTLIAYDRLCCKFLRHTVVAEPHSKKVWLYLTGGSGTKDFIEADLKRRLPEGSRLGNLLRAAFPD